ncbi:MAG: shikimate dehydrogenase [Clostridia bacterium]|nr:shikimate dehydrogenase [Clostridia bacterium]
MEYGLIGEKLTHSFSKEIHGRLADYEYELTELPRERLDDFMSRRAFRAINVTIPYKEAVIPYLDELSDEARRIGAVNTVVNRGGKLVGYNTDFGGLCGMLRYAGIDLAGKKVLILGSGGTSKTAMAAAQALGCGSAFRASRTGKEGCLTYQQATEHADTDVVLNTTPVGMFPHIDESPLDLSAFPALSGVADVIFNPLATQLCLQARERGIPAANGLYMLVAQAALACEHFIGKNIPPETAEAVYRKVRKHRQNIVLIGMPGVGKTTVGQVLANSLDRELVDTDALIEARIGMRIADFFAAHDEAAFRDLESEVLRELAPRQGLVIATGGGAVLRPQNCRWLRANGTLYFLDRPLEQLAATADRPLSRDRAALTQRFRERYPIYRACADKHINAAVSAEDAARQIAEDFSL